VPQTTASAPAPSAASDGPAEYDPDGKTWFAGPPETPVPEDSDADLGPDEPGAVSDDEAGAAYDEDASAPADDVALADPDSALDPCGLVDLTSWQTWVGSDEASAQETSAGTECLYLEPSDSVRLSVAYEQTVPGASYLTDEQRQSGTAEPDIGAPAYWLTAFPVPYASTMVVDCPGGDLVFMIFSRGAGHSADDLHVALQYWAGIATMAVRQ